MRGLVALILPLLAVAALAASCGGDDGNGEALSEEEYIEQAEQVCEDAIQRVEDIPEPQSEEEVGEFFDRVIPVVEESLDELRALEPPPQLEDDVNEWLDLNDQGIEVSRDFANALEEGDEERTAELGDQLEQNDQETDELAQEIGIDACAEDATE